MTNDEYKFFCSLCYLSDLQTLKLAEEVLSKYYEKVYATKDYVYAEGTLPALVIAHADTVQGYGKREIFYDRDQGVIFSPSGLGADDRAGVFAIFKLVQNGYFPHILITNGEEAGCIGASQFVKDFPSPTTEIKYILEIDRAGANDAVQYECDNPEFMKYVESFGYREQPGSFTDVVAVGPVWKRAIVNISSGYYREHTPVEYLRVNELAATIKRVQLMLDEVDEQPVYEYINKYGGLYQWNFAFGPEEETTVTCSRCGKTVSSYDIIPMAGEEDKFFCIDCCCDDDVEFCESCGGAFIKSKKNKRVCPTCNKKIKLRFKNKKGRK